MIKYEHLQNPIMGGSKRTLNHTLTIILYLIHWPVSWHAFKTCSHKMVNIADAEFDSCTEDKTLSGIFFQEMIVRRDMGKLEVPSNKDMEDGVEGLAN